MLLAVSVLCGCTLIAAILSLLDELAYNHASTINNVFTADELTTKVEYLRKTNFNQSFFYSQNKELEGELLMRISALSRHVDENLLGQSSLAFRSSIEGNPADGPLWAKFAMSKALLKQFDSEFDNALHKAFEYGGWDAGSTETIIRIGLTNTQGISVESLLIVKESLRRLYGVDPWHAIGLAKKTNQLHLTCTWVRDMTPVNPWCRKELQ